MAFLDKVNGAAFYDGWESQSAEEREKIIRIRLKEYISFAVEKIDFYRERITSPDWDSEYPLKNLPILDSKELRELVPPKSIRLLATPNAPYTVFQSGGTTGFPKTSLFTCDEIDALDLPNARGFFALGLDKKDRVANLFAVGGLYMTFVHINRMLQQYGCMNFPFSNHTPADFIAAITRLFNINCFAGITSVVLDCLRQIAKMGTDGVTIDKVFYGGEHIYEADRNFLKETFGTSLIAAPGYGTVDTWYIGYQCKSCPPGVFHAHDDQAYIEIVQEETQEHCKPEDVGMLFVTPFVRRLTPIVRYRVGDRAYWLKDPCSCGRTTPCFKLLGRGDDILRIGYDFVDYAYILDTASAIPELTSNIQIEKQREAGMDRLIVRVETSASSENLENLRKRFEEILLANRLSLRDLVKKNMVWPPRCELLTPGSIPRNPRTGKFIRVIDSI